MTTRRAAAWAFLGLVLLAGATRLWRLDVNPPYYADECVYTAIARTTAQGEARYGALRWPFARESNAKPPLWFLVDAPLQWLPGSPILKARLLSAAVAFLLLPLLIAIGRRVHSPEAGFFAAWISLIHAPLLLYGRWATPYLLAGLFNGVVAWAIVIDWTGWQPSPRLNHNLRWTIWTRWTRWTQWIGWTFLPVGNSACSRKALGEAVRPLQPERVPTPENKGVHRWALPVAAVAAGLAAATDFFSFQSCIFVFLYAIFRRRWRAMPGVLAGVLLPTALFVAWGLAARGDRFLREFGSLFLQFEGESGFGAVAWQMLVAARTVFLHDPVVILGLIGLAIGWSHRRARPLVWFLLCMAPLILRRQGLDREFPHNATSYAFAFYAGFGIFIAEAATWIARRFSDSRGAAAPRISLAVVSLPLLILTAVAFQRVATQIPMGAKALGSVRDVEVTRELAMQLNADLDPDDLAVVPERLVPLLDCRAVTPAQVLLAEGHKHVTWYRYATPDEFAFPVSLDRARIVVLDAWDRLNGLIPENPNSQNPFILLLHGAGWKQDIQFGEYTILHPPARSRR